jgi:hypothetical protein
MPGWTDDAGVIALPGGARVRGRRLSDDVVPADFALVLADGPCRGGVGRTGTALAALAVLDGLSPSEAVGWVRQRYHPMAVETPWQRWWLRRVR